MLNIFLLVDRRFPDNCTVEFKFKPTSEEKLQGKNETRGKIKCFLVSMTEMIVVDILYSLFILGYRIWRVCVVGEISFYIKLLALFEGRIVYLISISIRRWNL